MSVVRTLIGNVKGPKGDTGSQGPQGVAGTIEIGSVQTVSYGAPASVTNSGTEEEAILDFQIPQGAPGATVTDMSNLVLSSITDSTADYPAFAVSETGSTIFGKIRKFLSDLKANYVSKAMMTTSTNIDTEGEAVADAKAIKTLNDSVANCATKTELANNARMVTLPSGQSATVTFSTYQTVALFFTTHNNSNYEMFMYSNGYIAKNGSDTGLTATLSSDYKTVTLNNTSGQYYYIGILHPDTATMTISAPN